MCVNHFNISHFDPGYAIIESEYVFVILKREMSLFSSCRRCTYTISDGKLGFVDEKNALGFRIGVQGDSCT